MKFVMMIVLLACLPFYTLAQAQINGDTIAKHTCSQPQKPRNLNQAALKRYQKKIKAYRQCIVQYVKKHTDLAEKYSKMSKQNRDAANAALKDWNSYVKEELEGNKKSR